MYICDPVPQQTEEQNKVYLFYEHLREGRLTTTKCKDCGHITWPPKIVCNECISDNLDWIDFPPTGKIYAFTVQVGGVPPGFEAPLVYALIDFDNGVRIISEGATRERAVSLCHPDRLSEATMRLLAAAHVEAHGLVETEPEERMKVTLASRVEHDCLKPS